MIDITKLRVCSCLGTRNCGLIVFIMGKRKTAPVKTMYFCCFERANFPKLRKTVGTAEKEKHSVNVERGALIKPLLNGQKTMPLQSQKAVILP